MIKWSSRSRYVVWVFAALGLVGAALVMVSTSRYGIGMSSDSLVYTSGARGLMSGDGLTAYDRTPIVNWAPLYSVLLAFLGLTGAGLLDAARYLNAVCFGLVIFASGIWLRRHVSSTTLVLLGTIPILFAKPLIFVSSYAWTEAIFVLLLLLFAIQMGRLMTGGRGWVLVLSGVLAGLAFLTRYVGVVLVPSGVLLLLMQSGASVRKRLLDAAKFVAVAGLVMAPCLIRNYMISSTLTGARHPAAQTLARNAKMAIYRVGLWLMPSHVPIAERTIIGGLVALAILVFLVAMIRRARSEPEKVAMLSVLPAALVLVAYGLFLVAAASRVATDTLDDRLLSPDYVLLMLLIPVTIERLGGILKKHLSLSAVGLLTILPFVIWLAYPVWGGVGAVRKYSHEGAGRFLKTVWNQCGLIDYLRENPPKGAVASNAPEAIYILTGIRAKASPVRSGGYAPNTIPPALVKFGEAAAREGELTLVWFARYSSRPFMPFYPVSELARVSRMTPLFSDADGTIYRVQPLGAARSAKWRQPVSSRALPGCSSRPRQG